MSKLCVLQAEQQKVKILHQNDVY